MKHILKFIPACMAAALLFSGCGTKDSTQQENQNSSAQQEIQNGSAQQETQNGIEPQASSGKILSAATITEVFGDGQKPSAVALEYPGEIDGSSLSVEDFRADGQTIAAVYTNSQAALTDTNVSGNYVILRFSQENTADTGSMGGRTANPDDAKGQEAPGRDDDTENDNNSERNGNPKDDGNSERNSNPKDNGNSERNSNPKDGGNSERNSNPKDDGNSERNSNPKDDGNSEADGGQFRGKDAGTDGGRGDAAHEKNGVDMSISVIQTGEILGTDGTVYAGGETAVESSERIDLVVQDFELLEYTDPETGCTIPYSIYLPADYDESKEYPLLFFVADASANGDDLTKNLTQGNGAIVWATPEEQAKHECIVLSPQYTNTLIDSLGALVTDDNVWSDGLTLVSNLLHYVIEEYSVDKNRIYGTGQSQGCMTNIALSDKYPDLFAAQLLVAGQWNVEEMSAMKDKNLWIVVCEGDSKAYPGMNAATENWESLGSSVARSDMWDSTLPPEKLNELAAQTEAQGCNINYTVFEGGSHTYTWSVAYNIEGIRDWLFAQTRE